MLATLCACAKFVTVLEANAVRVGMENIVEDGSVAIMDGVAVAVVEVTMVAAAVIVARSSTGRPKVEVAPFRASLQPMQVSMTLKEWMNRVATSRRWSGTR